MFIDETGASTKMARLYGRAPRGRRLRGDWGGRSRAPVLPPYSPDFNPIETAFAKLKALLRKAAARAVDQLWAVIGASLDTFTPAECANSFAAAGYDAD